MQQHLNFYFYLPSIFVFFFAVFPLSDPLQASWLLPSCSPNSTFLFISPSSFLACLKQTITFSLNFILYCSALCLIYFPIFRSDGHHIAVAVCTGFSSTHCSCYNFPSYSTGLLSKENWSCFLVNLPASALPSIFSVPTAVIQLASTTHSSNTCSSEDSPAGIAVPAEELCDSLSFPEQPLWLYHPRRTLLLSKKYQVFSFVGQAGELNLCHAYGLYLFMWQVMMAKASALLFGKQLNFICCITECCSTRQLVLELLSWPFSGRMTYCLTCTMGTISTPLGWFYPAGHWSVCSWQRCRTASAILQVLSWDFVRTATPPFSHEKKW